MFISLHAIHRMREMNVDRAAVLEVIHWPEVSWRSTRTGLDRTVYQAGELAVVTQGDVVITVLPRTQDTYIRKETS